MRKAAHFAVTVRGCARFLVSRWQGAKYARSWRVVAVSSHREWWITCRDIAGRRRDLQVIARKGQVVLVAPPGETAILSPLDVGRLRAALRDAVVDASLNSDH
jgi:hypothetical protein